MCERVVSIVRDVLEIDAEAARHLPDHEFVRHEMEIRWRSDGRERPMLPTEAYVTH